MTATISEAPTPVVGTTPPAPGSRRLSWDVIRVLAISSVVVQHATYTAVGVMPWLTAPPIRWSVEAGASTLMVISAFFVCTTLAKGRPGRWWLRRLARLLPAYLVAVVVTYLCTLVASRYGYWHPTVTDLVGNLLLLVSWDGHLTYLDGGYWTLPLQLTIFTLAALAAAHVGRSFWRLSWTLPVVAWAAIAVPLVVRWTGDAAVLHAFFGMVMFRWQLFGIGLAVWLWSRGRLGLLHLLVLTTAGLVAEYVHTPDLPSTLVLAVACLVVITAAGRPEATAAGRPEATAAGRPEATAAGGLDRTWLTRGPVGRVISWLAGISYGIYLLNQQIGYFLAWLLEARLGLTGWPRLLVVLATAVLLGWLITVLVERPAYRLLTGTARSGTQRGKDAAAARNRSFCSGEPMVTRTPEPANARTTTFPSSV